MSYADGSGGAFSKPARLRRARSPVRTSPLVSELTLTCEALPFATGLAPLTCRAAPVNSSTFAALTTPEGLRSLRSASSRVPRYLQRQVIPSHSFAVRTRAYCAPHKWLWRPTFACLCRPPRDPEGRRARTRQRHLAARLTYLLLWDYTLSGLIESRFFSSPAICTIEDTLRWWVPTPSIRSQSVQEAKYAT